MAAACSAVIFLLAPTLPQHLIKSPSESKRWARKRHQKKTANWELFFCMGTLRWPLNNRHLDYIALSSSFAKAASQSIPSTSECSAWRAILAGSECLKYMKRNQLKNLDNHDHCHPKLDFLFWTRMAYANKICQHPRSCGIGLPRCEGVDSAVC